MRSEDQCRIPESNAAAKIIRLSPVSQDLSRIRGRWRFKRRPTTVGGDNLEEEEQFAGVVTCRLPPVTG
jgi:hypothetical protein